MTQTMTRRSALAALAGPALAQNALRRRPNLVVLLADDLGYGDLGCYGSPDVPTPNIDRLAKQGTRCTDGYVSCAVCSPSRVALLTGRYQQRVGHEFNSGPIEREAQVGFGLPPGTRILPQMLKPAGYKSAAIGKWHLGVRPGYHPLERGFDEFYGFLGGANAYAIEATKGARAVAADGAGPKVPAKRADPIRRGREIVNEERYLTDALAAEAVDFIRRNASNPFFLYLAFNAIHTPLHTTERYLDRVASIKNEKHRLLAAMTVALDDAIGSVLTALEQKQLDNDTLVVFLSDNGCPLITGAGSNGPLNGEKATYYEGGIRIPFILRWPGRIPANATYRQPVVSRDIAATFLPAAGAPPPPGNLDGVNLLPYLRGEESDAPHTDLFWRGGTGRAMRRGRWKLLEHGQDWSRLYDLENDLGEKVDVSGKQPAIHRDMKGAWQDWSKQMRAPLWPARSREITVNGEALTWEL